MRLREGDELIPPTAFICAAERFHLIEEIDRRMIAAAVSLIRADPASDVTYHVNLSGVSIVDPGILAYLHRQLSDAAVEPARLTVEITETAAITDLDVAQRFAHDLRRIGPTLALDDFGSGCGSFSYLKRIPVQFLKIDDSFITGVTQSESDRVVVTAIVDVAHGLGSEVIAEHVRDQPTRDLLDDLGVDYGQGFHFGRPVPALHSAA